MTNSFVLFLVFILTITLGKTRWSRHESPLAGLFFNVTAMATRRYVLYMYSMKDTFRAEVWRFVRLQCDVCGHPTNFFKLAFQ